MPDTNTWFRKVNKRLYHRHAPPTDLDPHSVAAIGLTQHFLGACGYNQLRSTTPDTNPDPPLNLRCRRCVEGHR